MTHPTDIDLDASAMTRREALEKAQGRLTSVVRFCLDLGLEPDAMDKESIREAFHMVNLALRSDETDASVERVCRLSERLTREMTAELLVADLLEALELWRDKIRGPGIDMPTLLHLTDAAIAKAKGEAQ